jgi:hypothetical protein
MMTDDQIRVRITVTVTRQEEGVPQRATQPALVQRMLGDFTVSRTKTWAEQEAGLLLEAARREVTR